MSRQKRLDAIARTRAFVESQMQMMSSNESKLPNIIRGGRRSSKRSGGHVQEHVVVEFVDDGGGGECVPIVITEEIAKLLGGGQECVLQVGDGGEVMVVIEGGDVAGEGVQGGEEGGGSDVVRVDACEGVEKCKEERVKLGGGKEVKRKSRKGGGGKKPVVVRKKEVHVPVHRVDAPVSRVDEEKPRPFRFELPEVEDEIHAFMSVPVPIKIDSLQSATCTSGGVAEQIDCAADSADQTGAATQCPSDHDLVIKSTNSLCAFHGNDTVTSESVNQTEAKRPRLHDHLMTSQEVINEVTLSCEGSNEVTLPSEQVIPADNSTSTPTIQSERIKARNDRIRVMDENSELSLGVNFRNLFDRVTGGNL